MDTSDNLLSRELYFQSNTSRGVCLPQQLLLKFESTSRNLAAKREHGCPVGWIGSGKDTGRLCLDLTEQKCSKWAAIGLIGKMKS